MISEWTYRFHSCSHVIVPLSLLGQPGFLHQLLAVDHVCGWGLVAVRSRFYSAVWGWNDWYCQSQCSEILREPHAAAVPCCLSVLRADGTPSPLLSLPPSLLAHSPSTASSLRKVGVCASDVTARTWEPEGPGVQGRRDAREQLWAKGPVGNGVLGGCHTAARSSQEHLKNYTHHGWGLMDFISHMKHSSEVQAHGGIMTSHHFCRSVRYTPMQTQSGKAGGKGRLLVGCSSCTISLIREDKTTASRCRGT